MKKMNLFKTLLILFSICFISGYSTACNFTVSVTKDTAVCYTDSSGFKLNVSVNPSGNYQYEWLALNDPNDLNKLSHLAIKDPLFLQNGNKTYSYIIMVHDTVGGNTCTVSDTMHISVKSGFGMNLPNDTSICKSNFTPFNININPDLFILNSSGWGAPYLTGNSFSIFYDLAYLDSMSINYLPTFIDVVDSSSFCRASDSFNIYIDTCSINIWPGDANNDSVVNMLDILPIGIASGAFGPPRDTLSYDWLPYEAITWKSTFASGLDIAYADCNGNGAIGDDDVTAISQNYSLTHNKNSLGGNPSIIKGSPFLYYSFDEDTVADESLVITHFYLGDSALPISSAYGIVFSIFFDPSYVVDGSFQLDVAPFFGVPNIYLSKEFSSSGQFDVGIVSIDQTDTSGFGEIAGINFIIEDVIAGSALQYDSLTLSIGNVKLISYDETEIPLNVGYDTLTIYQPPITSDNNIKRNNTFNIYPNPFNTQLHIEMTNPVINTYSVTLFNLIGQTVYHKSNIKNRKFVINRSDLTKGIYFIKLKEEGINHIKKLIVN